jgi:hypothetical protein
VRAGAEGDGGKIAAADPLTPRERQKGVRTLLISSFGLVSCTPISAFGEVSLATSENPPGGFRVSRVNRPMAAKIFERQDYRSIRKPRFCVQNPKPHRSMRVRPGD